MGALSRRILVVEDEEDILVSLCDLLRRIPGGCEVETAMTYGEGQAKLQAGPWDVVITDERLPDGRGVTLLGEVAIADPNAVRVLMSAHTDYDALMRGVNVGRIEHFVQKPFDALREMVWITRSLEERDARRLAQGAQAPAP